MLAIGAGDGRGLGGLQVEEVRGLEGAHPAGDVPRAVAADVAGIFIEFLPWLKSDASKRVQKWVNGRVLTFV